MITGRAKRFVPPKVEYQVSPASFNFQTKYDTKACRVPFNCSAPAQALNVVDNEPTPCTYTIKYRKHRIQGGVSPRFTSERDDFVSALIWPEEFSNFRQKEVALWYRKCDKGGDGKKFVQADDNFKNKFGVQSLECEYSQPVEIHAGPAKYKLPGKIIRGKTPRFEEDESSTFVKSEHIGVFAFSEDVVVNSCINKETQPIEPIYYTFPFEVNQTTLKYHGNHWSKMKSKRKPHFSGDADSPGIGTYDLLDKPPKPFDVYYDNVKLCNRMRAKSLRTLDIQKNRIIYLDEPGPADYEVVTKDTKLRNIFDQGTFSRAERKTLELKDVPQSDLNIPIDYYKPKSHQKCWPPFNSSKKRSKKLNTSERSPADLYIWNHTIVYRLAKELSYPRVVYPFNSSSERNTLLDAVEDNPDPAAYCIDRFPFRPPRRIYGAKDANTYEPPIKRISKNDKVKKEIAPCTYEVDSSYKKLHRKDFHKGEVWRRSRRDRLGWLVLKASPDVIYSYGDKDCCVSTCKKRVTRPEDPRNKTLLKYKPPRIKDYYANRLHRRVRALVLSDACRGNMSPFPWCADTERFWS